MSKRNILITAKNKEQFEDVEKMLDLFSESYIKKFQEARANQFSSSSSLELLASGVDSTFEIPTEATDFAIEFLEGKNYSNSDIYIAKGFFRVKVDEKDYFFSFVSESYTKYKGVKSVPALAAKK